MKKFLIIFFLIAGIITFVIVYLPDPDNEPLGDLTPVSSGEIVQHSKYKLAYSEENEQPLWVFYTLTPSKLNRSLKRTDDFRADTLVKTFSSTVEDYKSSGYDRGHLCPAADMKYDATSLSESFYMSNMSPQEPSFNRGVWSKLEGLVRAWGEAEDSLYVVTGPVFLNDKGTIGANKVTVPGYYYKVIFDPTGNRKMIALLLPNDKTNSPLERFVVSVDSVEKVTGIDFFPGIPDKLEKKMEQSSSPMKWNFSATSNTYSNDVFDDVQEPEAVTTPEKQSVNSTQCLGIAKSTGVRCKSKTTNSNGYCTQHQSQAPK